MTDVNAIQTAGVITCCSYHGSQGGNERDMEKKLSQMSARLDKIEEESEEEYGGTEDKTRGGEGAWADQQA